MTRKTSSLQKGLVLHLPLDKESLQSTTVFADKTPNENAGTSENPVIFVPDRMGQVNRAMSFNGIDDYVNCMNDGSLDITDAITVGCWIYPIAQAVQSNIICKFDGASSADDSFRFDIEPTNHKIKFYLRDEDGSAWSISWSDPCVMSEWNHVVGVFDGYNMVVYVNSIAGAGSVISKTDKIRSNPNEIVTIGASSIGSAAYNGSIADVRIYNRALSPEEVTALYEQYRPKVKIVAGKPYTITGATVAFGKSDEVILVRHSKVEVRVKSASYQIDGISGRS